MWSNPMAGTSKTELINLQKILVQDQALANKLKVTGQHHLFLVRYPQPPVSVPGKGKVTIGRSDNNTIVLTETRVSRLHAQVEYQFSSKTFTISDLGSANGTYINGQRINALDRRPLANWDKIRIASTIFTVRLADDPALITSEFRELLSRIHLQATEVVELTDIKSIVNQSAISGNLEHVCAVELFQMLEHGAKTGVLSLKSDIGEGTFTFKKGKIISASFGKSLDEKAVYGAIRCSCGSFSFSPRTDITKEHRITAATTALLMEGCRLLDEENTTAPPRPSTAQHS